MGAYKLLAYKLTTHVNGDFQKILLFPRNENNFKITAFFIAAVSFIAYLFSCHSTALDANYWTLRMLSL